MDKLSRENVGKKFTCENEENRLSIEYKIIDQSFSHEFGTQHQYDYEVESVKQYTPEFDKCEEISDELYLSLEKVINYTIQKDL